jgi:hypothetical protein
MFLDEQLVGKSEEALELSDKSNIHEWGYTMTIPITVKSSELKIEVFDVTHGSKFETFGGPTQNFDSRYDEYVHKGEIIISLDEILRAHVRVSTTD